MNQTSRELRFLLRRCQCDCGCRCGPSSRDRRRFLCRTQHVLRHGGKTSAGVSTQAACVAASCRPNRLISGTSDWRCDRPFLAVNLSARQVRLGLRPGGLGLRRRGGRLQVSRRGAARPRVFLAGLRLGRLGLWSRGFNFDPGESRSGFGRWIAHKARLEMGRTDCRRRSYYFFLLPMCG